MAGLLGDLLHVGGPRHADREDHLVHQEADADQQEGGPGREQELGEAVAGTDQNQDHRFGGEDEALAERVHGPAQERLEEDADGAAQGEERGHDLGGLLEHLDQDPGREGDEELLARPREDVEERRTGGIPGAAPGRCAA